MVAASDGVWDNWLYPDVSGYFLQPDRVAEVMATNSAESATAAFMQENARRANTNFGSQVGRMQRWGRTFCCRLLNVCRCSRM